MDKRTDGRTFETHFIRWTRTSAVKWNYKGSDDRGTHKSNAQEKSIQLFIRDKIISWTVHTILSNMPANNKQLDSMQIREWNM